MVKETLTERLARVEKRLERVLVKVEEIRQHAGRRKRGTDMKQYLLNDLAIIEGVADSILKS